MRHSRWAGLLAIAVPLCLSTPAWTAPVPGKKTPLAEVPATAPVVAHLRGVEGVADRLLAYLKNALPDQAPTAEAALKGGLMMGLDGRSLKAIPKDGPILLALLELPTPDHEGEPPVALFVSVTSYAELRDGLLKEDERKGLEKKDGYEVTTLDNGKPLFLIDRGEVVVITPQEKVARQLAGKKAAGLDTRISAEQSAKLLASDLGVYLSMDTLNKQYADQIKAAREAVQEGLKGLQEQLDKSSEKQLEMVAQMVGPAFQAVEDSKGLVLGIEFQPQALTLHIESEMRDGSATSKSLEGMQRGTFDTLARLPAGQTFYVGIQTTPDLLQLYTRLLHSGSVGADGDEAKAMTAAVAALAKAGPQRQIGSTSFPLQSYQVTTFKEPQKALDAQLKIIEALGEGSTFNTGALKGKPVIKRSARKYRDIELHEATLVWDLEKMTTGFGPGQELPEETRKQMAEAMKKLMGEKVTVWMGVHDKELIQVTADSWASAEKMLDQVFQKDSAVGEQQAYQQARKTLPEQTSALAIVDLPRYLAITIELIKPMLAGQLPIPPRFPAPLPRDMFGYIGVAVTLQPERASFDLSITAEAVKASYRAFVTPFIPADL